MEYVSKAEAWQRLKERVPKAVWESVLTNPLPASWEASLENPTAPRTWPPRRDMPGAEKGPNGVKYGGQGRRPAAAQRGRGRGGDRRADTHTRDLGRALIANTIRLSIFARRREVEVMKLVGASNWFVRLPFVLEGMLCGLGGAVLSIALLGVSHVLLKDHLTAASINEDGAHAMAFWLLAPLLLLAGTLLGAMGSGVTMRRFLRV